MAHPAITDPDLSIPITLLRYDGTLTATRGIVSVLPQTAGQLNGAEGAFSESGRNAYTETVADPGGVAQVRAADPATGQTETWHVLDREAVSGPIFSGIDEWSYVRFQLREGAVVTPPLHRQGIDFSEIDFDTDRDFL